MISLERLVQIGLGVLLMGQFSNPAKAITFTLGGQYVPEQGQFSTVEGAETFNFNSGVPVDEFVTYSSVQAVSGNSLSFEAPAGDSSRYLRGAPFPQPDGTNSYTINFKKPIDYFGVYWGSIDARDSISLYCQGDLLGRFTGAQLSSPEPFTYANFFANPGKKLIDSIILSTAAPAMETDNHAYRFASLPGSQTCAPDPSPTPITYPGPNPILSPEPQSVPEGGTLAMIGLAGIALFGSKRRNSTMKR